MDLFKAVFDPATFMPHGHCYFWKPGLIRLHVLSDATIVFAYYSIPIALFFLVRHKKGLPYPWMFVLFGIFIFSCGTTHLMEIWSVWHPAYWLSGLIKAWTGIVSILTAILAVKLLPQALALRSPMELEAANRRLEREMAEKKQAEEAVIAKREELAISRAELEQLELFSYVATHDLREPLHKIIAFGELLKLHSGSDLNERSLQDLTRIQKAARRMDQMIEELREYSKIGKSETPFVPVDLKSVAREALGDLELRIKEAQAQVEVGELPVVQGNRMQLRQLFQNLIGNAIKFRRPGEPCRVTVKSTVANPECVTITVEDNGIGFDETYLDRIFKPFQRLHSRDAYEGSGLGLAICQKIALHHRGEITARSVPGRGSAFVVTLAFNPQGAVSNA